MIRSLFRSKWGLVGQVAALVVLMPIVVVVLSWEGRPGAVTTLLVGFLVLASWLMGRIFSAMGLPKITGYLVFGLLVSASGWDYLWRAVMPGAWWEALDPFLPILSQERVKDLLFFNDLAIALIAFTAGGEIRLGWLKEQWRKVATVLTVDVLIILVLAQGLVALGHSWVGSLAGESWGALFAIGLLIGSVLVANSPAVVIAILGETRSSGPLSRTVLAMTVCKDLVVMVLFAASMAIGRGLISEEGEIGAGFLLGLIIQIFGSMGVGLLIGLAMALYVNYVRAHLVIFVTGCCMFIAVIGEQHLHVFGQTTHFEPLLMALAAGILVQNLWPVRAQPLFETIEEVSLPVYCAFFCLAGAKIDLGVFASLWFVTLLLVIGRNLAVFVGVNSGLRAAGIRDDWAKYLWIGLVPQAGISLVLVAMISRGFADTPWAMELSSILIGMIVVHELFGPIAFRWSLRRCGEVGQADAKHGIHQV